MAKIERKLMAHFINAAAPGGQASYERLGQDLEEYSAELSAQVEKTKNILGQTSVKVSSYQKQGSVAPYYADKDTALFERLQGIIDDGKVLDDCKTDIVEVKLWENATGENTYAAIKEEAVIEIVSYGGNTTGYQIPFNVHYTGVKTKGTFNVTSNTFTATT